MTRPASACAGAGGPEPLLVSACLLGRAVRYDGQSRPCAAVQGLSQMFRLIPVCPECLGGLPIPRTASEIDTAADGLRVVSSDGEDRTAAFEEGARRCLAVACAHGCRVAILKEKSPSCGHGLVYDGTFSGRLVPGDGVTARLLTTNGVQVLGENDVESWIAGRTRR